MRALFGEPVAERAGPLVKSWISVKPGSLPNSQTPTRFPAMAQQLWFLRHGEAEPHDARPDVDRRLTARGEEQSRLAGRVLAKLAITFQLVLDEPRIRALDTARLACLELGCDFVVDNALSSAFDLEDALALAHAAGDDKRVLFVGHNPDFVQVVATSPAARST